MGSDVELVQDTIHLGLSCQNHSGGFENQVVWIEVCMFIHLVMLYMLHKYFLEYINI